MPAATLSRSMRKRDPVKGKPKTARQRFAERLRELAGDIPATELAEKWGVTAQAVRLWLKGETIPDIELWQDIADTFGLSDYRDILPKKIR